MPQPEAVVAQLRRAVRPAGGSGLSSTAIQLSHPWAVEQVQQSLERAAIAGGVTRLVCPPDTDPPLDEPGLVEMLKPIVSYVSILEMRPFAFKFFLPSEMHSKLKPHIREDRFTIINL